MKRLLTCFFCLLYTVLYAQDEDPKRFSIDANLFYGTILQHNPDISHLITAHPTGVILAYNRKTYGYKDWEARYNYPDWGFSGITYFQRLRASLFFDYAQSKLEVINTSKIQRSYGVEIIFDNTFLNVLPVSIGCRNSFLLDTEEGDSQIAG